MSKVITVSQRFPNYHQCKGEPTYFVEKIITWYWDNHSPNVGVEELIWQLNKERGFTEEEISLFVQGLNTDIEEWKSHTIRHSQRFKTGEKVSLRVWGNNVNPKSGRRGPYHSKQIIILPDIEIKSWEFEITFDDLYYIDKKLFAYSSSHDALTTLSMSDGLSLPDFHSWFNKPVKGQIICWNKTIEY